VTSFENNNLFQIYLARNLKVKGDLNLRKSGKKKKKKMPETMQNEGAKQPSLWRGFSIMALFNDIMLGKISHHPNISIRKTISRSHCGIYKDP
jgi:hypothetical protein